jgi:hypothetical protein
MFQAAGVALEDACTVRDALFKGKTNNPANILQVIVVVPVVLLHGDNGEELPIITEVLALTHDAGAVFDGLCLQLETQRG